MSPKPATKPSGSSRYALKVKEMAPPAQHQPKRRVRICNGCGGSIFRHAHVSGSGRSIYCASCKK